MGTMSCGCVHRITVLDADNKPTGIGNTYCAEHDPANQPEQKLGWMEIIQAIGKKVDAPNNSITKVVIDPDSVEVTYIDLPASAPQKGIKTITVRIAPLNWQE